MRIRRLDLARPLRATFAAISVWLVLQTPVAAQACAVCSAGKDEENALAFLLSTIFMSLMPLGAIGTLVFVLWRRIQKLEQEQARPPASDAQPTRP